MVFVSVVSFSRCPGIISISLNPVLIGAIGTDVWTVTVKSSGLL